MNVAGFIDAVIRQIGGEGPFALLVKIVSAIILMFAVIIFFNIIQFVTGKILKDRISPQRTFIVKKSVKYAGFVIAALVLFKSLGLNMSTILGAAGVIGIAVGFAAQTSISNFISGFFLLSEKPFHVGDVIQVDTILGEVLSVDLLSVKIRTFDNLYVRIPNETLIKSSMMTLTRFPVRRLDIIFNVTYQADLEQVKNILAGIAEKNPHVLDNPVPIFRVDQFDRAGPLINFNIWFNKNNFLDARTSMYMAIQKRFAEEGIELSYQKINVTVNNGELPEIYAHFTNKGDL